jgi:hypothetical protein
VIEAPDTAPVRNGRNGVDSLFAAFLSAMTISTIMTGCDNGNPTRDSKLEAGWVTNCVGPVFSSISPVGTVGPGLEQPVFRVTDQLVLAVPEGNRPYADKIDHEPRECRKVSDLPSAHFLHFVIKGNWSAGYNPQDIPTEDGHKQFDPDYVTVRIEPAISIPSKWTAEEERTAEQLQEKFKRENYTGTAEIGGLTCLLPKPGLSFSCSGRRAQSDPDVVELGYMAHSAPHFVLVQAKYVSSRYGGIQVYWETWTLDPPIHALDIDAAIWKAIEDWNLLSRPDTQTEPRL